MAEAEEEEEEDFEEDIVVLQGSPLHEHLVEVGLINGHSGHNDMASENTAFKANPQVVQTIEDSERSERRTCMSVNNSPRSHLAIWLARQLVASELLLEEDVIFIENYFLTDEHNEKKLLPNEERTHVFYFGLVGLMGLVASGVFLFKRLESEHLAMASATLLPTMAATLSSLSAKSDEAVLKTNLESLLRDMKQFKRCLRKSLNFIKGQEQLTIVSNIQHATASTSSHFMREEHQSSVMNPMDVLPACLTLRRSIFKTCMQLLLLYRNALPQLLRMYPMEEESKEDYLAFVSLSRFNLERFGMPENNELSVDFLKDVAQLSLAHQSELLRRITMTLTSSTCSSPLSPILQEIQETLQSVSTRLGAILKYHSCWGIDKLNSCGLVKRHCKEGFEVQRMYKTLFTTGLQLQRTLLAVKKAEACFEMDPKSNRVQMMSKLETTRDQLADCLEGLDTNLKAIQYTQEAVKITNGKVDNVMRDKKDNRGEEDDDYDRQTVDEGSSGPAIQDEVFTAVALRDDHSNVSMDDILVKAKRAEDNGLTVKRVLKELKGVLVKKAEEHSRREQAALRRVGVVEDQGEPCHTSDEAPEASISCSSSPDDDGEESSEDDDDSSCDTIRFRRGENDRQIFNVGQLRCAPSLATLQSQLEPSSSLLLPRSLSAPDLKQTTLSSSNQAYVSMEELENDDVKGDSDNDSVGSADEMVHQVLKTYRRPPRAAALKALYKNTEKARSKHELDDISLEVDGHVHIKDEDPVNEHSSTLSTLCGDSTSGSVERTLAVEAALKARMFLMASNRNQTESNEDVFE